MVSFQDFKAPVWARAGEAAVTEWWVRLRTVAVALVIEVICSAIMMSPLWLKNFD
jgi:hypothetical protein